jgi:hypothetical protein
MMKKSIFYVIAIITFSACTNVSKPTITEKPTLSDYKVGEKWTWKWERAVGGEIRAEGETAQEVVSFNGELGFLNGVDTVKVLDILDEKPNSTPFNDWPLKVGKKWKFEDRWETNDGTTGSTIQDVEVVSFEEVTVIAGKYMAYKIVYIGRIVNSRGYDSKMEDTWWFAPAIKTHIKHTQNDGEGLYTKELISYSSPR